MDRAVDKVTAFITREGETERELLVFQRPDSGVQLPGGTVEAGETVEAGLLREVHEETGLSALEVVTHLLTLDQPLDPDERVLLSDAVLQSSPGDEGTLYGGVRLRRGSYIRVVGAYEDYDKVAYPRYEVRGDEFIVVSAKTGWLARTLLTADVKRHLFHLRTTEPSPNQWTAATDGETFALYWTALSGDLGLIRLQDQWYQLVRDQLEA
jgi:8-oxo-dGTP pyrophosphatase MutT (NUDIX family)